MTDLLAIVFRIAVDIAIAWASFRVGLVAAAVSIKRLYPIAWDVLVEEVREKKRKEQDA